MDIKPCFIGEFDIENGMEKALTRPTFTRCFVDDDEYASLDRRYEVLIVKNPKGGQLCVVPNDNQHVIRILMSLFPPKLLETYFANGTLRKELRHSFKWHIAKQVLCSKLDVEDIALFPSTKPTVQKIQIRTSKTYREHVEKMIAIRHTLERNGWRFWQSCYAVGPCALENSPQVAALIRNSRVNQ